MLTSGHLLLFVPGVLWLAVLCGETEAIAVGLMPFVAATVVKTMYGLMLAVVLRRVMAQWRLWQEL